MKCFVGAEIPVEGDVLIMNGKASNIIAITNDFIYIEDEDGEIQTLIKDEFSFDPVDRFIDNGGAQ